MVDLPTGNGQNKGLTKIGKAIENVQNCSE
jgi:hypothetical protein